MTGYLEAIDAGNRDAAFAMMTRHFQVRQARVEDPLIDNATAIDRIRVSPARIDGDGVHARVAVTFDLRQHRPASFPDGFTIWGYELARDAASGRWFIDGEGVG